MKKAVVFYGSMRELEMGSKSWHILGEDVDYFVVTWEDVVNNHYTDASGISSYPCDLSNFPVPIRGAVKPNFAEYSQSLTNIGLPNDSLIYVLYHWSLISLLVDIHEYDQIIIARPDMFSMNTLCTKWNPDIRPGKVTFSGNHDCVNDWVVTTDPAGLATLHDLYYDGVNNRDLVDEFGKPKIIHSYLYEKIKANPEKFHYGESDGVIMPMPPTVLIRPNYPKAWLKLPHGPMLAYLLVRHYHAFEQAYTGNATNVDELTIQLLSSTDYKI
jgi:hypothetical protein